MCRFPRNERAFPLKGFQIFLSIFLVLSIIAFSVMGFLVMYQELNSTYALAEEAVSVLKTECQKFENYTQGIAARSLQDLLDAAVGLKRFISPDELLDDTFLREFILTEHVGGVVILDDSYTLLAQADMDHQDAYSLWADLLSSETVKEIFKYPQKTYVDHTTLNNVPYDLAVTATDDGKSMILCYASTEKPSRDPYELTIGSLLTNKSYHKNPTLVITDGTQVLSTNDPIVEELGTSQYKLLSSTIDWKDDGLTKFRYNNTDFYGLRRVYGKYFVYAVYASSEVFSTDSNLMPRAFMIYLGICVIVLMVQRHFDKLSLRKMEKQLRIINAISTSYSSTFLLHIDRMELEPINPSARLKAIFEEHPNPYDFLFAICKTEVAPEYHPQVMHFLDLDTIAARLKGQKFLGNEVKDCHGTWYSILLIPQRLDDAGNVQALLVATRDVTSMKQAEELSFKDKLTGLHNRNYMESRSQKSVRAGDLPVTLIMADCNYLKRTNDTLGHEYGDLLLQRVANIIRETIPEDCVAMRVGGDEFLILCTQCEETKVQEIIGSIKKKLAERSDEKLTLSVSFGISTTHAGEPFDFEKAYEAADEAMYRDKQLNHIKRES